MAHRESAGSGFASVHACHLCAASRIKHVSTVTLAPVSELPERASPSTWTATPFPSPTKMLYILPTTCYSRCEWQLSDYLVNPHLQLRDDLILNHQLFTDQSGGTRTLLLHAAFATRNRSRSVNISFSQSETFRTARLHLWLAGCCSPVIAVVPHRLGRCTPPYADNPAYVS